MKKISLAVVLLAMFGGISMAQEKEDSTRTTDYEELFEDKPVESSEGMMILRKMDGKVYFEFPTELLDKKMLLGASVEATSNAADAAMGEQPDAPLPIYFTMDDSTIYLREVKVSPVTGDSARAIQSALEKNNLGPILDSFDIEAVTPDSSALVFDATGIFINGRDAIDPFGPYAGVSSLFASKKPTFKKGRSQLVDVSAFEDNITITSYLSYDISSSFLGFQTENERPATYRMKHTLVLLPDQTMRPRISDPRIGISSNEFYRISGHDNGTEEVRYANRWELRPEDPEAFREGKPVEPVVFYIDNTFPDAWVRYVEEGVEDWNKAFEQVGFKNALVTRPFPEDDPDFDPNNIKYTTINYVFSNNERAKGRTWVDPRSGEILSASVSLYQGVLDRLRRSMFIQIGAAEKRVRTTDIPDELLGKAIRDVTARQVGQTLGLTRNIGAASAIPVDSLRSPSFTRQYGITPSIMDNVTFNYVAQPGDVERGVKMTPNDLGVYDYYAIKWLYTPIQEADSPEEEVPTLRKWIADKIDDPMYRYREYDSNSTRDPNSHRNVLGLLGSDRLQAARYAIKNLKYVFEHMNEWVNEEDEDYRFQTEVNFSVLNIEFYWYWRHVLTNIGGIYQHRKYEGDPFPAFEVVSEAKQRRSLTFLLESLEATSWMNNERINREMNNINGDVQNRKIAVLFPYILRWGVDRIEVSQQKAYGATYTQQEFLNDVFDYVWESTMAGSIPTRAERMMQTLLTDYLIDNSPIRDGTGEEGSGASASAYTWTDNDRALLQYGLPDLSSHNNRIFALYGDGAAMSQLTIERLTGLPARANSESTADISDTMYTLLKKSKKVLETAVDEQEGDVKEQYEYLLLKLTKALEAD
ncbi:protein of unknown function [Fodinibius roseus]|uniref:Zinc-dependent metalloprotease n=1 Tax=Fodinibius roseus TaxID=1194090 RepID=A0A1M5AJP6_9BACT|nr:zinc-dependent metalloprotease [Fodinibius roseus]SHF30433.1 protein of unknown function [Fodinibius roseus]